MDWVPDLIGIPPRRERNGGDQIQKTIRTETRRIVNEIEIAVEIETQTPGEKHAVEKPVEIESETEKRETQSDQSDEIGETRETEIVGLEIFGIEIESQS